MPNIKSFDFFLGGYGRDNFRLKLNGAVLLCSEYEGIPSDIDKEIKVEGNTEWETLAEFIKGCKWKKTYNDPFTCDGTQWELKVSGNGININSYGSNLFPENFDEFMAIVNKIMEVTGIEISK
jgi:hypothetical protein